MGKKIWKIDGKYEKETHKMFDLGKKLIKMNKNYIKIRKTVENHVKIDPKYEKVITNSLKFW